MKAEIARRQSNTAKVIQMFRAKPRQWISWALFSDAVGERGYRTRISNAKKVFVSEGGTIERRTYVQHPRIITEYRWLPEPPLGRDATLAQPDRWPVFGAPYEESFKLTTPK